MEMLANRYLLNGRLEKALKLYQKALADDPDQPALQCRLTLAKLELNQLDEAAGFVKGVFDAEGFEGLRNLSEGCAGFVPSDVPHEHPAVQGLRALLAGEMERARELLSGVDTEKFPRLADLINCLEN